MKKFKESLVTRNKQYLPKGLNSDSDESDESLDENQALDYLRNIIKRDS